MANIKWRWSESLPIPFQAFLVILSLVVVVTSVGFSLAPEHSWGDKFSSLLFDAVASHSKNNHSHGSPSTNLPQAPSNSEYASKTGSLFTISPENAAIASPAPESSLPPVFEGERFLMPHLTSYVGAGNQLMEYASVAVVARALNRTLCLTPFFSGPSRHSGLSARVTGGMSWEDRYDVSSFSKFTRVMSIEDCMQRCNYTLDATWYLRSSKEPLIRGWLKYPPSNESLNLDWSYATWQSAEDIRATFGNRTDRCVGLGGLFPGLRWRGPFLAVSAFLQPAPFIFNVTNALQEYAFGMTTRYMAVHWRFEESDCGSHQIGLCFTRCSDGSVIDSGLHPLAKEWLQVADGRCRGKGHFRGVGIDKMDIIGAIEERASNHSLKALYLATDGWIRGNESIALVKQVVELLRSRGLTVIGLWKIQDLPNFADGTYFDPLKTLGQDMINSQVALVDQEMCSRAAVFLGSGQSTWSLAVFRLRLAHRRVKKILLEADPKGFMKEAARNELVVNTLLKDKHAAGLHCRYSVFMKRAAVSETIETYVDEYPDGWLDLEACEGRVGRGGHCQVAKCFSKGAN